MKVLFIIILLVIIVALIMLLLYSIRYKNVGGWTDNSMFSSRNENDSVSIVELNKCYAGKLKGKIEYNDILFKGILCNLCKNYKDNIVFINYNTFPKNANINPYYCFGGSIDLQELQRRSIERINNISSNQFSLNSDSSFSPDYVIKYNYNDMECRMIFEFDEGKSFHQSYRNDKYVSKNIIYDDILRTTNKNENYSRHTLLTKIYKKEVSVSSNDNTYIDNTEFHIPQRIFAKYEKNISDKINTIINKINKIGIENMIHSTSNANIVKILIAAIDEFLHNPIVIKACESVNLCRIRYADDFAKKLIEDKVVLQKFIYVMNGVFVGIMKSFVYEPSIFLVNVENDSTISKVLRVVYNVNYDMYKEDLDVIYDNYKNDIEDKNSYSIKQINYTPINSLFDIKI